MEVDNSKYIDLFGVNYNLQDSFPSNITSIFVSLLQDIKLSVVATYIPFLYNSFISQLQFNLIVLHLLHGSTIMDYSRLFTFGKFGEFFRLLIIFFSVKYANLFRI